MTFLRHVISLVAKDLRVEARQKELLLVACSLSILLAVIAGFGVRSAYLRTAFEAALYPGLVWIIFVFAATVAVSRCYDSELELGALEGLLTAGVKPEALYLAKMLVAIVIAGVSLVTGAVVLAVFLSLSFNAVGPALLICAGLVVFGYGALASLCNLLVVRSRLRHLLFPLIFMPLLFPLLFAGIELSAVLLVGSGFSWASPWVTLLIVVDIVYVLLGINLFRFVVSE